MSKSNDHEPDGDSDDHQKPTHSAQQHDNNPCGDTHHAALVSADVSANLHHGADVTADLNLGGHDLADVHVGADLSHDCGHV